MNQSQRRRWDPFAWVVLMIVAAIAVYGGVSTYANGRADSARQDSSIAQNSADAVTNCMNANESREASRALWTFVIDAASRTAPPEQTEFFVEFRDYVNTVYRPHDCQDLGRKYPLPDPPKLPR